jgi:hypothetical protein
MRRLGAVAALAAVFSAGGCGTMMTVLDIDSRGREAYGGVTRDLKFIDENPLLVPNRLLPHSSPGCSSGSPLALAGLILFPAALLTAEVGIVGTELSLSWVGDTCTLPLVPALNRFDGAFLRQSAVRPEDLPGCAASWLRDPWVREWATKDVESDVSPSTSEVRSPEQPSEPKSRTQAEFPLLLSTPEVRQGMARWEGGEP